MNETIIYSIGTLKNGMHVGQMGGRYIYHRERVSFVKTFSRNIIEHQMSFASLVYNPHKMYAPTLICKTTIDQAREYALGKNNDTSRCTIFYLCTNEGSSEDRWIQDFFNWSQPF